MMAAVLDEIKAEFAGRMDVMFVDVRKKPEAGHNTTYAVSPLLAYGLGHCAVIVFVGSCTEKVQH